jgi:hypothetical protein
MRIDPIHLQRNLRRRGHIRIGYSTRSAKGHKVPHKLKTFMFTAPDRETIDAVATLFGGDVKEWDGGGDDRWAVVTNAASLDVVFPSKMSFDQCFEQYEGAGYLYLRCDGTTCWTPGPNGRLVEQTCVCDPNERDCQLTTRLSVLVPKLPGLGAWELRTGSFYAAVEMSTSVELIEQALSVGARVPARLFLTEREVRRIIDGEHKIRRFMVVALDLAMSVAALGDGGPGGALDPPADSPTPSAPGAPPALPAAWRPVDKAAQPPTPPVTVAAQLAQTDQSPQRRANAAPAIPATGIEPRTVAQIEQDAPHCSRCGERYGTERVVRNPDPGGSRFIHAACAQTPDDEDQSQEGEPEPDQPPARDQDRDQGGAATGEASVGEPALVAAPSSPRAQAGLLSGAQNRNIFRLLPKAFPAPEGMPGHEVDTWRRFRLLDLCAALGQPDIESRTEITFATANVLIDALESIVAGLLVWSEDHGLVGRATGEIVAPRAES